MEFAGGLLPRWCSLARLVSWRMCWLLVLALVGYDAGNIDRDNRTARISFQFHHTVIAAAPAAAAAAVRSKCRACAVSTYADRGGGSSSSSITRREEMQSWSQN